MNIPTTQSEIISLADTLFIAKRNKTQRKAFINVLSMLLAHQNLQTQYLQNARAAKRDLFIKLRRERAKTRYIAAKGLGNCEILVAKLRSEGRDPVFYELQFKGLSDALNFIKTASRSGGVWGWIKPNWRSGHKATLIAATEKDMTIGLMFAERTVARKGHA